MGRPPRGAASRCGSTKSKSGSSRLMLENSVSPVAFAAAAQDGTARHTNSIPLPMRRFMQRSLMGALCALLVLANGPTALRGQTITTGVLQGVVRADSLDPLGDVIVTLTANEGGAVRSFTTARNGEFRFSLLAPGIYTVLVGRLGYRPKRYEEVQVRSG